MSLFTELQDLLTLLPAWAFLLFLFGSALLEYVIPPYWGDLFLLLGFFWALQGNLSPVPVFLVGVVGGSVGAAAAYGIGRRHGLGVARRIVRLGRRAKIDGGRVDGMLERFGTPILAVNRFLPVLRGLMLYGAGALRLPFGRSMAHTFLSNVAWGGLLWSVAWFSRGLAWSELVVDFRDVSRLAAVPAGILLLSVLVWAVWRERRISDRDRSRIGS